MQHCKHSKQLQRRSSRLARCPQMGNPVNPLPCTKSYLASTIQADSLAGRWVANGGPRWATLLDEMLFVLGSLIFVVGSLDFFPDVPFPRYVEGCELFIIGSAIYLALSLFAVYEIFEDAKRASRPPDVGALFEQFMYCACYYHAHSPAHATILTRRSADGNLHSQYLEVFSSSSAATSLHRRW